MGEEVTTNELTEARIRRILDLHHDLSRKTRKDAKEFLHIDRMPDTSRGENLFDVVAPSLAKYFAGWNEDPIKYLRDRDRMLMIFHAVKAGGIGVLIDTYRRPAKGEWISSAINHMKEKGFGNPAAAEEMLRHTASNVERQVRQLQTVSDAEERAVRNCVPEIEDVLFHKRKR